jgi:hypothetical protein
MMRVFFLFFFFIVITIFLRDRFIFEQKKQTVSKRVR